jgi:phage baseplate assembly protein W
MDEIVLPASGSAEPARYDASFVGRGFFWPMQVDHTGSIRLTDGASDIDAAMAVVLATAPGERVMRPDFGCRIWDLLFEPVTANLIGLMAQAVREALAQWEPRVEVDRVDPVPDPADSALISITVAYRIKATNDRRNLVFPFYVIPDEVEEFAYDALTQGSA